MLSEGSSGPAVVALQNQLIGLGFHSGTADAAFGSTTARAVRDAQRRLLLLPDGIVGPRTSAALAAAVARQAPAPTSFYRRFHREALDLAARGQASLEKLPWLDRGLASSPFRDEPPHYAERLATSAAASELTPYPDAAGRFGPYPARGVVPAILSGQVGRGGLEFLSEAVAQACLCVGSVAADRSLRVRWYGRQALEANVQFWSAT
ncbi:MAG: peptidoglycan-binding domain-containing protein, partial [Cyanobacteriota bacterium]|nr:peptidoglycan-binding domain-containing protein [Cyanobacteriota bacterium]